MKQFYQTLRSKAKSAIVLLHGQNSLSKVTIRLLSVEIFRSTNIGVVIGTDSLWYSSSEKRNTLDFSENFDDDVQLEVDDYV